MGSPPTQHQLPACASNGAPHGPEMAATEVAEASAAMVQARSLAETSPVPVPESSTDTYAWCLTTWAVQSLSPPGSDAQIT